MRAKRSRKSRRAGVTLVEVIATAALSALLLTSLSRAIRLIHRHDRILQSLEEQEQPWLRRLQQQIESDVLNSRRIHIQPDGITLWGHGGRGKDGQPTLRPSRVRYSVVLTENRSWLIRERAESIGDEDRIVEKSVLGDGVARITAGRPEDDLISLRGTSSLPRPFTTPARLRCVLFGRDDKPLLDTVIWR